jgi:hypothetical protein
VLEERRLHRMQLAMLRQPFNCRNFIALMHDGEGQAGIHPPSVHEHRARSTLPVIASLLGAKEVQMLPQRIQQCHPGLQPYPMLLAIHLQDHRHSPRGFYRSRRWRLHFFCTSRLQEGNC